MRKTALVTGASRGIGKAVARRLARDGFAVVVNNASNAKEADATVAEITADGGQAIAVKADVGNSAEVEQMFDETVKAFGSIDVVVNNSGIMSLSPIGKGDVALFDKVIQTNLRGTFGSPATGGRRKVHCVFQQRAGEVVSDLWPLYRFKSRSRGPGPRACE
jgi:3-oxoacyl-[acyl-carrier protein] reductase